jgi:hypothetical protein
VFLLVLAHLNNDLDHSKAIGKIIQRRRILQDFQTAIFKRKTTRRFGKWESLHTKVVGTRIEGSLNLFGCYQNSKNEVAFTVPDMVKSEISSHICLKDPHP